MISSGYYYQFLKATRFFSRSVRWNRQQILDYQDQKVREIVVHAGRNVPWYRQKFAEIGLDVNRFRGLEDMHKIPLLDKETVRKNPGLLLADNHMQYGGGWKKTSGSTGTPLRIWIDNYSKAHKYAAVIRAYNQGGYRLMKKSLVVQGYSETKQKPFGYRPSSNSLYYNASANNEKTFLEFYPLLKRFSPSIIMGYSRVIAHFGQYIIDNKLQFPQTGSIINYGQNMPEETIMFLLKHFNCNVFDVYSHVENAVLIHTFRDRKLRIAEDFFYPEFIDEIDPGCGQPVTELVGTSFYNYAMPLIRYKTRDFIVKGEERGDHGFRSVEKITGRVDDKIILPNGCYIYFAEGALGYAEGIIAAQYIQEKQGELKILLIVDNNFERDSFRQIEKGLVKRLGTGLKYNFVITDQLERNESGKVPFIINRL